MQSRPKVGLPARAPARRFVAAMLHGYQSRLVEFRGRQRRDVASGVQGHQVRNMAVGVLGIVSVVRPFLQLSVLADFLRAELGDHALQFFTELRVCIQNVRRFDTVGKQVQDHLLIPSRPVTLFVSCLLYTSPSPRDRTRSRMPSSA